MTGRVKLPSPNGSSGARRTVLVVDDEEGIRAVAADMLEYLGYTALTDPSGEAALARITAGARPDLIIIDVVMPGLGGVEAFRRMRKIAPGLRFVFSSGFADKSSFDALAAEGASGFIVKPYLLEALSERVRTLLGESPVSPPAR
jgi:two-component system, cell cycle sensor histidine kinase and response regulator CckA